MSASIMKYILALGAEELSRLYTCPFTAITVFRTLPTLAQQYVLRLVYVTEPVSAVTLNEWRTDSSEAQHNACIQGLLELGILASSAPQPNVSIHYLVNTAFAASVKTALANQLPEPLPVATLDVNAPSFEYLSAYANKAWQSILHFMVRSAGAVKTMRRDEQVTVSNSVRRLLVRMGLMQEHVHKTAMDVDYDSEEEEAVHDLTTRSGHAMNAQQARLVITSRGFSFLFKTAQEQVWEVLTSYLAHVQDMNMDRDEAIAFIFKLGFLRQGVPLAIKRLSKTEQTMVVDFSKFGLVLLPEGKEKNKLASRFYATHIATSLSSSQSDGFQATPSRGLSASNREDGFIIVENTFKVYAFTTSPLHTSLLSLFTAFQRRLPLMITGVMSKESVTKAFRHDITAENICTYLRQHAHPKQIAAARGGDPLPQTVVDQLRLWEEEKFRMRVDEGVLISTFTDTEFMSAQELFVNSVHIAKRLNALLWATRVTLKIDLQVAALQKTMSIADWVATVRPLLSAALEVKAADVQIRSTTPQGDTGVHVTLLFANRDYLTLPAVLARVRAVQFAGLKNKKALNVAVHEAGQLSYKLIVKESGFDAVKTEIKKVEQGLKG